MDMTARYTWEAIKNDLITQINGIRAQDGFSYRTTGADLYRAKLYPNVTAGAGKFIASATSFDDFALAPDGFRLKITSGNNTNYAYAVTAVQNSILQISFNTAGGISDTAIIARSLDSTDIAEPIDAAFGRGDGQLNKLYVTNRGCSGKYVDLNGIETAFGA